jgi:basic membrane protein A and related proteins
MRKLLVLLVVSALSLASAQDYVFGITFDAGGKFDGSFNEGTWRGMVRAIEELEAAGRQIDLLEFEGTPETAASGLRSIANQNVELIVSPGFGQADAVAAVAAEHPDTYFVNIDGFVEAPNVQAVLFKEHEGSFLVGFIAGTMTQTGVVGFVGGMDIPLIRAFNLGYEEGVKYACPDCTVISNYVGVTPTAWNDPARAKELAANQQAQGADIIYAAAGASGGGVIDFVNETMCFRPTRPLRASPLGERLAAIEPSAAYASACGAGTQPLFFIGVDSNQNPFGDLDGNPSTLNHGLTSMLKRVDVASYNAVMAVANDTFEPGIIVLGLAEEGVGYALDEYNEALLTDTLIAELRMITDMIVSGQLQVTDYREQ